MRKTLILLVDDDALILELVRLVLPAHHYQVDWVTSAQAAMEQINLQMPDLVLLDLVMPGLSGLDLCRLLKNNPLTTHLPVVIISGLDSKADMQAAKVAGASGYICKPVVIKDLQWQIEKHL